MSRKKRFAPRIGEMTIQAEVWVVLRPTIEWKSFFALRISEGDLLMLLMHNHSDLFLSYIGSILPISLILLKLTWRWTRNKKVDEYLLFQMVVGFPLRLITQDVKNALCSLTWQIWQWQISIFSSEFPLPG